jgi:4-amino-4-deoxy-L-arabinose transferase-like glycosyltransferase
MTDEKIFLIGRRHFYIALVLFILLMKASFFTRTPTDWDEGVYLYLAQNMGWLFDNYSLKGSLFERELLHNVYSSPVFHHPPLIPYMIKILSVGLPPEAAAKLVNFGFIFLSFFLVYNISLKLAGSRSAYMATVLWALCPVFNLESNLIHLDFPCTVLMLAGIWCYICFHENPSQNGFLFLSATGFASAMLVKFTAPVYILVPLSFIAADRDLRNRKAVLLYIGILFTGFAWWFYIIFRLGSLIPHEFFGSSGGQSFTSPYLSSISKRHWYHVWLYFTAICPLFIVYLYGIIKYAVSRIRNPEIFRDTPFNIRILAAVNISLIVSTFAFNIMNAYSNGYWILRHNLPIFPIIYITIAYITRLIFDENNKIINAYFIVFIFLNMVLMSFSTLITMLNQTTLKAVPAIFFWIPGASRFFY